MCKVCKQKMMYSSCTVNECQSIVLFQTVPVYLRTDIFIAHATITI